VFIALSHIAGLAAAPLTWALLLLCAAVILGVRPTPARQRLAAGVALLALLVLAVFSSAPVSNALFRSLERDAPASLPRLDARNPYDAVIVLSGLLDAEATESGGAPDYTDAVDRLHAGFDLLRTGRARAVLLSGGSVDPRVHEAVEARVLSRQLQSWGIAEARIVVEDQSRNTRENAVNSARIVRERGWQRLLLVTSAFHMQRAAGAFRAAGLSFDTLPVDFRWRDPARFPQSLLPRAESLAQSTLALHEWVGRLAYRWRGYSAP
jgi:uncharacterized SAM-binding protein YcdF (DUF218 family)